MIEDVSFNAAGNSTQLYKYYFCRYLSPAKNYPVLYPDVQDPCRVWSLTI